MSDCNAVHPLLAEAVYDDLQNDQAAVVRRHLSDCPACQAEFAALREVRDALNAVPPVAPVRVDVGRLYREASRRQTLRLRRWRRTAAALGAVAALLLVVFFLRLEVRLEAQQLVLRWGAPEPVAVAPAPPPQPPVPAPVIVAAPPEVTADDLRLVKQLIHALAANQDTHDEQQTQELLALRQRLDRLQIQADRRWATTEYYVSALQTNQSQLTRKE